MTRPRLSILYASFATLSIAVNLLTQDAILSIFDQRFALLSAIALGTLAGLALKYTLDKIWIFSYKADNAIHDIRTFIAYSTMGIVTTGIFWATEYVATLISSASFVRNTGAIIGLVIGYYIKYHLDKRFVFRISTSHPKCI